MANIGATSQGPTTRTRAHHQRTSSREEPYSLEERMDRMDDEVERALNEGFDRLSKELSERDDALEAMIVALRREVEELPLIVALRKEVEELKEELERCKTAVGRGVLASMPTTKVDVPKPKEFKGTRSTKEVDNFIWGIEQYLRASNITNEATKVSTASMYLGDIALLWWRRRAAATPAIETWDDFKKEFKSQFFPEYAEEDARAKLRRLTQRGEVREYVREFFELMLQISDLDMKEAKFMFLDELKPWAKQELQRKGVEDLHKAMAVAESLIEFKKPEKGHLPKERAIGEESGDEDEESEAGSSRSSSHRRASSRKNWDKRNGDKDKKPLSCFLCEGPHRVKDYPKRSKLSAIVKEDPQSENEREILRLGAIRLSTGPRRPPEGLMSGDESSDAS
ncbi:Retrotransposon gag protein [Corchorus capsularis]|uniref:Retrotransposon gag protein n=1 Tax=Corchorus capsularis TaxID=210143 RepID=A0A1R3HL77_COCAP|nr:Retrotransposon gag protein [Corchorus capsularis]